MTRLICLCALMAFGCARKSTAPSAPPSTVRPVMAAKAPNGGETTEYSAFRLANERGRAEAAAHEKKVQR